MPQPHARRERSPLHSGCYKGGHCIWYSGWQPCCFSIQGSLPVSIRGCKRGLLLAILSCKTLSAATVSPATHCQPTPQPNPRLPAHPVLGDDYSTKPPHHHCTGRPAWSTQGTMRLLLSKPTLLGNSALWQPTFVPPTFGGSGSHGSLPLQWASHLPPMRVPHLGSPCPPLLPCSTLSSAIVLLSICPLPLPCQ